MVYSACAREENYVYPTLTEDLDMRRCFQIAKELNMLRIFAL